MSDCLHKNKQKTIVDFFNFYFYLEYNLESGSYNILRFNYNKFVLLCGINWNST